MNRPEGIQAEPSLKARDFLLRHPECNEDRVELFDGSEHERPGVTIEHSTIVGNVFATLRQPSKRKGCQVHAGDLYVARSDEANFLGVPDLLVRCGPSPLAGTRIVSDPNLIVEVLPHSTMLIDRGYKLERYFEFETLLQVLLIYQTEARVEAWTRRPIQEGGGENWEMHVATGLDKSVVVPSLNAYLSLADIYEDITFPEPIGAVR